MKTVWRALTLMADSVHYFSHNVAFFFFFFFFLPGTTCTKTQSHIHLQPTFLQPGKTFHKSTPSEHPTVIPVSPPSRFSYPGLVTLSSACSSIKWTYSVSREGKLEILLNMCVWVTTIGASDWEQLIQLVWKQLWLPFVPHKTIWIIQINVILAENLSAMELLESPVSVWSLHIDQLSRWIDSYTPTIDDAQLASQSYTGRKCWRLSLSST